MTFLERNKTNVNVKEVKFRLPKPTSKSKRWYMEFSCIKCKCEVVKTISNIKDDNWLCNSCSKGRWTRAYAIKQMEDKYPNKFTFDNLVWSNNKTKTTVTCKIHGNILVRPADFLSDRSMFGCKACADEYRFINHSIDKTKATLYYVYLPTLKKWKLGATTQTVRNRFHIYRAEFRNPEVIWTVTDSPEVIIRLESILLSELQSKRYKGSEQILKAVGNHRDSGSYELLNSNVFPTALDLLVFINKLNNKSILNSTQIVAQLQKKI